MRNAKHEAVKRCQIPGDGIRGLLGYEQALRFVGKCHPSFEHSR
jgi:hypothetical protein